MQRTAVLHDTSKLGSLSRSFARLVGLDRLQTIYEQLGPTETSHAFIDSLLRELDIRLSSIEDDLARIPRTGPVVVVANHPFGMLDGAVLGTMLSSVRKDFKILANSVLAGIPELADLLIPVVVLSGTPTARLNATAVREAIEVLARGGMLVLFPAGEVSHFQWRTGAVTDSAWHPAIASMLRLAFRRSPGLSVVPAFIGGANSLPFQAAGLVHPRLRTLLLPRELMNKRGRTVEVRIGTALAAEKVLTLPTEKEQIEYLRWRTYVLASRKAFKPRTALPLHRTRPPTAEELPEPAASDLMAREIAALPLCYRLAGAGEYSTYIAQASQIPETLREIGRLREIAFRAAGEGTGNARDLDEYDERYLHLFVWNEKTREVAGAYRLAGTDEVPRLYTHSLFRYGPEFLRQIGPALELGRSFVRLEYQRMFQPLLLLWKGIGAYVARNPRYKVLFGPVSISNQYQTLSRKLIVSYLTRYASMGECTRLVSCRTPFRSTEPKTALDLEDLSALVSDLEPGKPGVPVLLRQYLKLGGKLLGFNLDEKFSNVVDGLILVDLTKAERKLLERYLGRAEAERFLAFQNSSPSVPSPHTRPEAAEYQPQLLAYSGG